MTELETLKIKLQVFKETLEGLDVIQGVDAYSEGYKAGTKCVKGLFHMTFPDLAEVGEK